MKCGCLGEWNFIKVIRAYLPFLGFTHQAVSRVENSLLPIPASEKLGFLLIKKIRSQLLEPLNSQHKGFSFIKLNFCNIEVGRIS